MRKTILLALSFLALLYNASAEDQIKIGVNFGLTGQAAYWSSYQLKGIQLAVDELNAAGENIKLVVEDSGTTGQGSVKAYLKLVEVDKVDVVIGNIWNILTKPIIPLAVKHKILTISPQAADKECQGGKDYFYIIGSNLNNLLPAYKDFFRINSNIKTASYFAFDDPGWGAKQSSALEAAAKESGVTVLNSVKTVEYIPDYKALITKALGSKPDAFFFAHEPGGALKAIRTLNFKGLILSPNAILETLASNDLERIKNAEGVYFADTSPSQEFILKFRKAYGTYPFLEAATGYEAARSAIKAIKNSPSDPASGMKSVKYQGVTGEIDFSKECSGNNAQWKLFQIKNRDVLLVE